MVNHPRRNKLAAYGGRIITIDERRTVQLVDPNDNAQRRFQFRRTLDDSGIERRVLRDNGEPFIDTGSPWQAMTIDEIGSLLANRGEYHPILDPLGF